MKNQLTIVILFAMTTALFGQDTIAKSGTIKVAKSKPIVAVETDKMNILYIGLVNPITIAVAGIPENNISVSISAGSVKGSNGKYEVTVSSGTKATMYIYNGTILLDSTIFRIRTVPNPVPSVGGKTSGNVISKQELLAAVGVQALMDNFYFDLSFPIISFDMSCKVNGVMTTEKSNGNNLTEQMKKIIASLKSGDKIYFENYMTLKPDSPVVNLGSCILTIK